jgi:hypothetical protein
MINRVKGFRWIKSFNSYLSESKIDRIIKRVSETRQPCSCHMCGNARKLWKQKSLKEKKFELSSKEFLELDE